MSDGETAYLRTHGQACSACDGSGKKYRVDYGQDRFISCAACAGTGRVTPSLKSYEIGSGEPIDPPCTTGTARVVQNDADLFPGNRKEYPVFTGLIMYFPDACAEVARCSYLANEQHNPGQRVHWDRAKSIGEGNELLRHLMQSGTMDGDGIRHSAKVAWRALELLQREIEAERNVRPAAPLIDW